LELGLIADYSRMKVPTLSRGCEIAQLFARYMAPQTKILEGGTKDEMRLFEALFKGESTRCGQLEKCFEKSHFIFCSSFQNLRLGGVKLFEKDAPRCLLG
jgi:hypothetical protein